MKFNYYLNIAKKLSFHSDHHTHKLGAVLVKGNSIIGQGFNLLKTHPCSPHEYKYIHAEFMAIHRCEEDVSGATLYVFRQQKNGTLANSKPCESCYKYLVQQGIKEIVYTMDEGFRKEVLYG